RTRLRRDCPDRRLTITRRSGPWAANSRRNRRSYGETGVGADLGPRIAPGPALLRGGGSRSGPWAANRAGGEALQGVGLVHFHPEDAAQVAIGKAGGLVLRILFCQRRLHLGRQLAAVTGQAQRHGNNRLGITH